MTARLVLAPGDVRRVADAVARARTTARVVASAAGPVWVLPAGPGPVGMDRVVQDVSALGPSVLVTVAAWRSELQVWARGERVRMLAWQAGTVGGLDPAEATAAAADLALVVPDADRRALARLLAGPRPGVDAWRDVVDLLGLPVPEGFPEHDAEALAPGQGAVVDATSFGRPARPRSRGGSLLGSVGRVWRLFRARRDTPGSTR